MCPGTIKHFSHSHSYSVPVSQTVKHGAKPKQCAVNEYNFWIKALGKCINAIEILL